MQALEKSLSPLHTNHHEICHPEIKRLLPREVSCRCFYSLAAGRAVAGEERKRRDTAGDTGIARC